jgi:hypothetical protein
MLKWVQQQRAAAAAVPSGAEQKQTMGKKGRGRKMEGKEEQHMMSERQGAVGKVPPTLSLSLSLSLSLCYRY